MKVIKPLKLGLTHRTYGHQGTHHFAVKPILFFDLNDPQRIIPEAKAWQCLMAELPQHQVFDEGMPKASPEVLLHGSAWAPGGNPVTKLRVKLSLGQMSKTLQVMGDRIWQKSFLSRKATEPVPFNNMPLTWQRAFGGQQYATNPVGQGALSQGETGETIVALPNVEYVGQTLTSPKRAVEPAGFGPLNVLWEPRTVADPQFDQAYMDSTFPALPDAMDFARYNMAPEDQRLMTLTGAEQFSLTNLHSNFPVIEGSLPAYRPRVFIRCAGKMEEIAVQPETVWFLPAANMGAILYCGERTVTRRYAQLELSELMLSYEGMYDAPRELDYYQHVLQLRTDQETGFAHVTDESQLSPLKTQEQQQAQSQEHAAYVAELNAVQDQQWQAQKTAFAEEHDMAIADEHRPPPIDPRSVIAPAAVQSGDYSLAPVAEVAKEKQQQAQRKIAEGKEKQAASEHSATPPSISEDEVLADAMSKTRDGQIGPQNLPKDMPTTRGDIPSREQIDRLILKGRAKATAPQPISFRKAVEAGQALREVVLQRQQDGADMTYRDYTGADLSNLDFSNTDLQGSIFECANLQSCSFAGANLHGASFVGATLDLTSFRGANLSQSNFCGARGEHTNFAQADLSGGVLAQNAYLGLADFTGASIDAASFIDSELPCADFYQASLASSTMMRTDLKGCVFEETTIGTTIFLDSSLQRSAWTDVSAERSVILNSQMQLANVQGGTWQRCQVAGGSWLTGATFANTGFSNTGLRSAQGTGASFNGSAFKGCDLAMTSFPTASFVGASTTDCLANDSDFRGADCTGAVLTSSSFADSDFSEAQLRDASFYQSDVLLARLSDANYADASDIMPTKLQRLENERS